MPEVGLIDIHCHIIPGVDDGAESLEDAVRMLRMEYAQGVRKIIATPHYRKLYFETPAEIIKRQFGLLKRAAAAAEIDIELYLGCEFHVNMDMMEILKERETSTLAGSRYVLSEFSGNSEPSFIRERIYSLLSGGYRPIVAHVERYRAARDDISLIEEIKEMGALIQVNADNILGKEGFGSGRFCRKLLKEGLVDFIASDCHGSERRISRLGQACDYVRKKFGSSYARRLFIENPQKIINSDGISLPL